ncbi:MAG: hypothetical protein M1831_003608 [Alyxoria varia]|nr:MAG: hypothetical protein M1831_003608 [Alyxoria varia]
MGSSGKDSHGLAPILSSNHSWASKLSTNDPSFFPTLSKGQSPGVLWIGCSDSRVPETTILGLKPGDVFVHRNIANCLPPTDLSSLSVIEYAVVYLEVQHIIVCGHTGCGGVAAALGNKRLGKIDTWLMPLRQLRMQHSTELDKLSEPERGAKLVELNVQQGVETVRQNPDVIQAAKERGLEVHGLVFDLESGVLKRLETGEETHKMLSAFFLLTLITCMVNAQRRGPRTTTITTTVTSIVTSTASPTCSPTLYPAVINDTTDHRSAFYIQVQANNPAYDGHNVQLRPESPDSPASLVVIDATSPVLAARMRNGTIESTDRNEVNQVFSLGPIGGLRNVSDFQDTARQAFIFSNNTASAAPSLSESVSSWQLIGFSEGIYGLYHDVPIGFVNGFDICNVNNGEYYQLFYAEGLLGTDIPAECESVGLQV